MQKLSIEDLKKKKCWISWNYEVSADGKMTKVPKNPHSTGNAKTNDPCTWGTYQEAETATKNNGYSGVGIVFVDGLCGIDIDSHNSDEKNPNSETILDNFKNTYIEVSPSGKGYHIICLCDSSCLPIDRNEKGQPIISQNGRWKLSKYLLKNADDEVEIYPSFITNRFFTFTGQAVNKCDINDMTLEVVKFLNDYMLKKTEVSNHIVLDDIDSIIDKARNATNGKKFSSLYDMGDISRYNYDSSRADLALCSMLAYWFNKDHQLIDSAFRSSALVRDKWLNREDYRRETINVACENLIVPEPKEVFEVSEKKRQITIRSLDAWLEEQGMLIRKNEVTHEVEISGIKKSITGDSPLENVSVLVYDNLKQIFKCSYEEVLRLLKLIAEMNSYNPIKELLYSLPQWDGKDRVQELYEILMIPESDSLSRTLIHKWLLMAMALSENSLGDSFGADGILVLQGKQGIGKTMLCSKLGMNSSLGKVGYYVDTRDKDTIIRTTSCWIAELGEIGCTFKSDIDRLKAFITQDIDSYRAPYARSDSKHIRHTAFIASTNDDRFLIDPSGSRRFWTVPCREKFDLERLNAFDAGQLWKQIEHELHQYDFSSSYDSDYQRCFRLTAMDREELERRNLPLNKMLKAQAEVEDILEKAKNNPNDVSWDMTTVSDWKNHFAVLNRYSAEQVGRALSALGIDSVRFNDKGEIKRGRILPCFTTWENNPADVWNMHSKNEWVVVDNDEVTLVGDTSPSDEWDIDEIETTRRQWTDWTDETTTFNLS